MKRRFLQALLVLSAVVFPCSLYAWGRSYWPEDVAVRSHKGRLVVVFTSGTFSASIERGSNGYRSTSSLWATLHRTAQSQWQILGFDYAATDFALGEFRLVAIPYPFIALLASVGPVWWAVQARVLRRRRREGRCAGCGYDLRESGGRCPECGAPAKATV
jgi:hypothetical protein